MIAILDYGVGNLFSIKKALEYIGACAEITRSKETIKKASAIVLPGVGAYAAAMKTLEEHELVSFLKEQIMEGKPTLGICLGMQLLFEKSTEHEECRGLSILKGEVKRLPSHLILPHMGWNKLILKYNHPIFDGLNGSYFYFVHSFYAEAAPEVVLATVEYGVEFPAAILCKNVFGVQFHPEKSQKVGLKFLKNFLSFLNCS